MDEPPSQQTFPGERRVVPDHFLRMRHNYAGFIRHFQNTGTNGVLGFFHPVRRIRARPFEMDSSPRHLGRRVRGAVGDDRRVYWPSEASY